MVIAGLFALKITERYATNHPQWVIDGCRGKLNDPSLYALLSVTWSAFLLASRRKGDLLSTRLERDDVRWLWLYPAAGILLVYLTHCVIAQETFFYFLKPGAQFWSVLLIQHIEGTLVILTVLLGCMVHMNCVRLYRAIRDHVTLDTRAKYELTVGDLASAGVAPTVGAAIAWAVWQAIRFVFTDATWKEWLGTTKLGPLIVVMVLFCIPFFALSIRVIAGLWSHYAFRGTVRRALGLSLGLYFVAVSRPAPSFPMVRWVLNAVCRGACASGQCLVAMDNCMAAIDPLEFGREMLSLLRRQGRKPRCS